MILRRIATAITNQNWSQVTVEILIVVIGIFLGLQVTEWNEGRQERVEELNYLTRLVTELDAIISDNNLSAERGRNALKQIELAIEMIDNRSLNETNKQQFETNFAGTGIFPSAVIRDSVLTEMVSTGKISLIRSDEIRSELISYYGRSSGIERNTESHYAEYLNIRSSIYQQINLSLDHMTSGNILDEPDIILNSRILLGNMKHMHSLNTVQTIRVESFALRAQEVRDVIYLYLSNEKTIDAEMEPTP